MKVIVVDNSVILKPILEEEGADKVKAIFLHKDRFELSILVPDIFCYEFFNILTKTIGPELALKAYNYLKRDLLKSLILSSLCLITIGVLYFLQNKY